MMIESRMMYGVIIIVGGYEWIKCGGYGLEFLWIIRGILWGIMLWVAR